MKSFLQYRFFLLRERIDSQGMLWTLCYYWNRISRLLFAVAFFKRRDLNIPTDARLGGLKYMRIGKGFIAGRGLWLEAIDNYLPTGQKFAPELIIGDRVNIGEYVHIGCNHYIKIGDDVLMGSKIYITDHNHGVYRGDCQDSPNVSPSGRRLTEGERVIIGDRCWIGEFVTILPGVTIGEGSIIGSHSTVTHDIPPNSIAVGTPIKIIKTWDKEEWIRTF